MLDSSHKCNFFLEIEKVTLNLLHLIGIYPINYILMRLEQLSKIAWWKTRISRSTMSCLIFGSNQDWVNPPSLTKKAYLKWPFIMGAKSWSVSLKLRIPNMDITYSSFEEFFHYWNTTRWFQIESSLWLVKQSHPYWRQRLCFR